MEDAADHLLLTAPQIGSARPARRKPSAAPRAQDTRGTRTTRLQAPAYAPLYPELPLREDAVLAPGEIVVVNFAGGGGASSGIHRAMNRPPNIAINHHDLALGMHRLNSPHTTHYIEDVWEVDPREVTGGRPVGLAQFSPDCTMFSNARRKKSPRTAVPRIRKVRGLAWVAVRWAATVQPRVIIIENVLGFLDWGPVDEHGLPVEAQKGRTFRVFVNALRALGYVVDWRTLRACDYGAGTTRERLFIVARRDRLPIIWPSPTHAAPDDARVLAGELLAWPVAADFIMWERPTATVFGRATPIVDASLERFTRGFRRWVLEEARPFLSPDGQASAFIEKAYGGTYDGDGIAVRAPLDTITTKDHHRLVTVHLAREDDLGGGEVPAATAQRRAGLVYDLMMRFLGREALGERADHARRLIILNVAGARRVVWDLRFRHMEARELFSCQGFPEDYIIDRTADGQKLTKTDAKEMCGNSVSPAPMAALTLSNMAAPYPEAAD